MKTKIFQLETELQELFVEYDTNIVPIEDLGITTPNGTPITHITNGSSDNDYKIGLWCGDPENDKNAEEMIVSEKERIYIYEEINELM